MLRILDQHGTPTSPTIIDGFGRLVDGTHTQEPIIVGRSSHVIVRCWDACRSSKNVILVHDCEDVVFEQVCAWDANPGDNHMPWRITRSRNVRLIDCAGWGTGRKTFTCSQGGNDCAFVRCWGRWEHSSAVGPHTTFNLAYNNTGLLLNKCIGECVSPAPEDYYGVFAADRMDNGMPAMAVVANSLAISSARTLAVQPHAVRGIVVDGMVDATGAKRPAAVLAVRLLTAWAVSPIRERVRYHAGCDPYENLQAALTWA